MIPFARPSSLRALAAAGPLSLLALLILALSVPAGASTQTRNGPLAFAIYHTWNNSTEIALQADGAPGSRGRLTGDRGLDLNTAWSPDGRRLAFVRNSSGLEELYMVNADGSGLMRLTFNDMREHIPRWSPDGTRIAYTAAPDAAAQEMSVYVLSVGANGPIGAPIRLTHGLSGWGLAWSPDGTRVAFSHGWIDDTEIYTVATADGRLTRLTDNDTFDGWPTWSPDGARIAFSSGRDYNSEIYVMDADGGHQTRLTTGSAPDAYPIWSPDGAHIAYLGGDHVMVMRPDGTGQVAVELQEPGVRFGRPYDLAWSPDGARLAYAADDCQGSRSVPPPCHNSLLVAAADGSGGDALIERLRNTYIGSPTWSPDGSRIGFIKGQIVFAIDAAGGEPVALTNYLEIVNGDPAWSPDGGRLAFSSNLNRDDDIHVMYAGRGEERRALTGGPANDWNPAWSPDGRRIAFTTDRDGNWDLYAMNADGGGQTPLTQTPAAENDAAWSPDGTQIAFARQEGGHWDLYLMNADGSDATRLTGHAADDTYPTWSADGTKIAFTSDRDGNDEIYVLTVGGPPGSETNLTRNGAVDDREPAWSPDGTTIAFTRNDGGAASMVYRMNADGSGQAFVRWAALRPQPAWQPQAEQGPVRSWVPMIGR